MFFAEYILVNYFISAHDLPNYPIVKAVSHFSDNQMIYGFGGYSSVAGVLLIVLLYLIRSPKYLIVIVFFTIFTLIRSGSGMVAFAF
jgi:hypothetical protein